MNINCFICIVNIVGRRAGEKTNAFSLFFLVLFSDNVLMGNRFANNQGVINLANNFTCGRNSVMGNIVTYASPYLYPFVVEYSLIGAAVVFAMWRSIGSNPRYYTPGEGAKPRE